MGEALVGEGVGGAGREGVSGAGPVSRAPELFLEVLRGRTCLGQEGLGAEEGVERRVLLVFLGVEELLAEARRELRLFACRREQVVLELRGLELPLKSPKLTWVLALELRRHQLRPPLLRVLLVLDREVLLLGLNLDPPHLVRRQVHCRVERVYVALHLLQLARLHLVYRRLETEVLSSRRLLVHHLEVSLFLVFLSC